MILADSTWMEVDALARRAVVLIPTGSLEQHGPHLPMFTDTILATAVSLAVEERVGDHTLLTPTIWLGASAHHLAFPGTLSASFDSYIKGLIDVVESLVPHGFERFFVLNGHGGNSEPNGVALRTIKSRLPNLILAHSNYYSFAEAAASPLFEGPAKRIQHACEAETSLMLHLRSDLVRQDKIRNDGLKTDLQIVGLVSDFDQISEQGSFGFATFATQEKGKAIFEAAVNGAVANLEAMYNGYVFIGE